MSEPMQFTIDFLSESPILVSSILSVLSLLVILHYYRTNPPVSLMWRIILGGLRSIAVVVLVLVLFETVIGWKRTFERKPRLTVIVDASQSMQRKEGELTRAQRVDSLIASSDFAKVSSESDIHTVYFGGNVDADRDKIATDATALGEALATIAQGEMTAPSDRWLLLSDGNSNSGRSPQSVEGLRSRIIAVDISSGGGNLDAGIQKVESPAVAFTGKSNQVRVTLSTRNLSGKPITVRLLRGDRLISQQQLTVQADDGFAEAELSWTPEEAGEQVLRVEVAQIEGEETVANNSRSFSVKVLKSRLAILIATEAPDYEVGFLKRHLALSDRYEVELRVFSANAGNLFAPFPSRLTELNRYDLVILYDPNPASLSPAREAIQSYLNDRGGALWVMMGERFARSAPQEWFNALLPFAPSRVSAFRYAEFRAEPVEGSLYHPVVRLADDQSAIREVWSKLPPFALVVDCDKVSSRATILAQLTSAGGSTPAIGTVRHGPGKVLAFATLPFWPWSFVTRGFGEDNSAYGKIIDGSISWLTVRDDVEPVRITPDKRVYTRGESVGFAGSAFDPGFRPLPSVNGQVTLTDSSGKAQEMDFTQTGDGTYRVEFNALSPGKYKYSGSFSADGKILKKSDGEIVVESYSLEEMHPGADPAALQAVASATGGGYVRYEKFGDAVAALQMEPVQMTESRSAPIWQSEWLLAIFIAALSLEWALRKMHQLL